MKEKLYKLIALILGVDANLLKDDIELSSYSSWDSLAWMRMVGQLNSLFHVEVPMNRFYEIKLVGDFINYIENEVKDV